MKALTTLTLLASASLSHAALVSIAVSSNDSTPAPTGAAVLGAAATDQWNIFTSANGSSSTEIDGTIPAALTDSTGAASALTWTHNAFYNHTSGTANDVAANVTPFQNGWFSREANEGAPTVTISGFAPGELADLAVFAAINDGGSDRNIVTITANGVVMQLDANGVAPTAYTAGAPSAPAAGSNYVSFIGLPADASGQITFTVDAAGNFSDFNGFQVNTAIPEPSTALLGGLSLLGLLRRRR